MLNTTNRQQKNKNPLINSKQTRKEAQLKNTLEKECAEKRNSICIS